MHILAIPLEKSAKFWVTFDKNDNQMLNAIRTFALELRLGLNPNRLGTLSSLPPTDVSLVTVNLTTKSPLTALVVWQVKKKTLVPQERHPTRSFLS